MTTTAAKLKDMTKALFERHPSAKPPRWDYIHEVGYDHASLIITGHLTQWLAEYVNEKAYDLEIEVYKGKWIAKADCGIYKQGDTLLEALIAAAMEVLATTNKETQ